YAPDGPASNGYSPTDPSMVDALNEVVNSIAGVRVLSMSFGTNDAADSSFQTAFSSAFRQATLEGITILGASGDNGGTTGKGCQGNTAPQFPSTSPMVVSVGGTAPVLSEDSLGTVTGLDSEPAWDRAGGGFSATYAAPSWQLVGSAAGPIRASGMRGGPDVAGPASDNAFLFHGGDTFGMGTSFATPMWAGLIAEMDAVRGKPMGFVTPHLYAVGAQEAGTGSGGLVDITAGGNCLGPAGPGWDTTTGWGSPRALPLFESVAGTFIAVSLNASPQPVAPGATLTSTIRAVNATSGAAISSLSVYLEIDSSGYSGPCGGTLASATGPTDANGTFSVGVPIPGCYFGTAVSLTVTVSGNGYYGSNQTIVSVNLAGLSGVLAGLQHYPYNVIGFVVIMAIATTVGLLISGRRRRRIRARRGPPPTPPPTAIASPAVGPPPRSPAPPPPPVAPAALEPSPSLLVAGTSDPSEPASVAVAAPALAGSPASGAASCDACGASVLSASVTCPSCGAPLGD
ncbi:MAG TPA: S8 family serine peptidase, partial [Thermoplasmata archaeon]|nr:S8 family serine peptidase [Thermoplasmata archaeon]